MTDPIYLNRQHKYYRKAQFCTRATVHMTIGLWLFSKTAVQETLPLCPTFLLFRTMVKHFQRLNVDFVPNSNSMKGVVCKTMFSFWMQLIDWASKEGKHFLIVHRFCPDFISIKKPVPLITTCPSFPE